MLPVVEVQMLNRWTVRAVRYGLVLITSLKALSSVSYLRYGWERASHEF